ncbi:tryptophan 2,3-dioxygenase [Natronoglycomyces albus]|uniref:Tryptophan 2,3-dioxygenase n=1 Tax=Natronoglycomyces albus TaxID=2811108 RepID=A0A895XFN1_9ACTN|nr:tryptophan 2,3-dioxygenase family protein [Natronoglycomyces albus]QSB04134.1 tryptophan 2,3-dioxygenase [Natronoglycomyces albus]
MDHPHKPAGESPQGALTYSSYLALDELLAAQRPRSDEHDEMLFIIIHQVYELWFKQMLHELHEVQRRMKLGETTSTLRTLRRSLSILKAAVANIDVLETMTPTQFASFRSRLDASSGFQSAQFRQLEALMGRRDDSVLRHYAPDSSEYAAIKQELTSPNLFDSFLTYLSHRGYAVPTDRDVTQPLEACEPVQDILIEVYAKDEGPAFVAEQMVDLDEGFQEWRYRHVMMVKRTIGDKMGTGGSSGVNYLQSTTFTPAFPDLWAVRSKL